MEWNRTIEQIDSEQMMTRLKKKVDDVEDNEDNEYEEDIFLNMKLLLKQNQPWYESIEKENWEHSEHFSFFFYYVYHKNAGC